MPDHLHRLVSRISEIVPSMTKETLDAKFGNMDHNSNSKSYLDDAMGLGYTDDIHGDFDIYEGGKCHYDPYFIYGFGRFGELDLTDPFDIDDLWKIHEIDHLALDEDDPFYHGHFDHFDHEFGGFGGDEFFQYDDPNMYEGVDDFIDMDDADAFNEFEMHDDHHDFDMAYDDVQDIELVDMWDHDVSEL